MSTLAPLPVTWRILTTVHCPSCGKDWNFIPGQSGNLIRDAYCVNSDCIQHGHIYTLEMKLDGVQIVRVIK